jgi:hypothetical protein
VEGGTTKSQDVGSPHPGHQTTRSNHGSSDDQRYTLTPEPLSGLEQFVKEIGAKWDQRLLPLKALLEDEV